MATTNHVCGICAPCHINKPSVAWCSECHEWLCVNCQDFHRLSQEQNHKIVPIAEYQHLPVNISNIRDYCEEHNEKFQLFCKQHERPCCGLCAEDRHRKCVNLTDIEHIIQNVKTSNSFQESDHFVTEILETIDKMRKNRTNNLSSVQLKRKIVEKEILAARTKMNKYLDQIQETLMKELNEVETNVQKQSDDIFASLKEQEKQLNVLQTTMSSIKHNAVDLKFILSVHRIELGIASIDQSINKLKKSESMKNTTLLCEIDETVQDFLDKIPILGHLIVQSNPFITKEHKQEEIIASIPSRSIENITLKNQETINTHGRGTRGCALLSDGRMFLSFYGQNRVRSSNKDGSPGFDNSKLPSWTFDIAYIDGTNTIAVTSGGSASHCIRIVNMESGQVEKTVRVGSFCYGIVYKNDTLIYCVESKGLCMLSLRDGSVSDVFGGKMSMCSYLASNGNKFYYTDNFTHTVTCCILHGTVQWQFKDESILKCPCGITVDNDGNVYVVGEESCNVVVISPDHQHGRQVLGKENGLVEPRVLHYDNSTSRLLVVNRNNIAFLFKVEKSQCM